MTVIRPNSISGVTSITALANEINVFKHDGVLAGLQLNGVNHHTSSGVSTFHTLNVLGNVSVGGTLTYQDVTNVDSLGIGTFRTGINVSGGQLDVGSNIKLGNAGVITATSFVGSGANLTGIQVGGATTLGFNDDTEVYIGSPNGLKISHVSSSTTNEFLATNGSIHFYAGAAIELRKGYSGSYETMLKANPDGAVELYHNNVKKIETTSAGVTVTGAITSTGAVNGSTLIGTNISASNNISITSDTGKLNLGASNDLQLFHSGSHSYIQDNGTGALYIGSNGGGVYVRGQHGEESIIANSNGSVELYHDNAKKFETSSAGVQVTGALNVTTTMHIPDGSIGLQIGNSNDLMLYHDGNNNYIKGTGNHGLIFSTNNTERAFFRSNGNFVPWANNSYDIGESGLRWRNIYTNDLNLSNKGSTNSVDNTWGDFTIQEGESDLFLINNRNGKKYKFNLTEVL